MQINTHLFLVHDDLIPNITPALDARFRPCNACLLTSPATAEQAERLERILKNAGVRVARWEVGDPWDIEHLRERILDFVVSNDDGNIVLNASGGTRPMGLAAYEVFRNLGKPVYYIHPERDHVVWLHPHDRESFDLADRIRLPAFFAAHGMKIVSARRDGIPEHLRGLTDSMIKNISRFSGTIGGLNWLAATSEKNLLTRSISPEQFQTKEMRELLGLFSANGLLKIEGERRLRFADQDALFYVNGGWLEEHIFGVICGLRKELPAIQDIARNVLVEWDVNGSPVNNELDVAFLADNKLYIIECKTKRFEKGDNAGADAAHALYKLDTLRDYMGGAGARAMLVSYRPLSRALKERAEEFGVRVCEGDGIRKFGEELKQWIGKGS